MTWKPDPNKPLPQTAMVTVVDVGLRSDHVCISSPNGVYTISADFLSPLPPGITPEQQAVIEAAAVQGKAFSAHNPYAYSAACFATVSATRAMLAAQQPQRHPAHQRERGGHGDVRQRVRIHHA